MASMSSRTCERPRRSPPGLCWGQWGFVAAMAALALLAASCAAEPAETARPGPPGATPTSNEAPEPAGPTEAESPEPEPTETAHPVPRELRFTAPRLGGGQIRGAEYAGRDVAVWFWAPW